MTIKCPNCDQKLLEGETVCWQCGQPLAESTAEPPAKGEVWRKQRERENDLELSAVAIYGILTFLVIAAAFLLTLFLGSLPRLQAAELRLPADWSQVTNYGRSFTLYLPGDWLLLDAGDGEQSEQLDLLWRTQPAFQAAGRPLAALVEQERPNDGLIFLGSNQPPQQESIPRAFLLVFNSQQLNQLTAPEVIEIARESGLTLTDAQAIDDPDKRYVSLDLEMADIGLLCQQQWIPGEKEALLAVACTRPDNPMEITLEQMLISLQRLHG